MNKYIIFTHYLFTIYSEFFVYILANDDYNHYTAFQTEPAKIELNASWKQSVSI